MGRHQQKVQKENKGIRPEKVAQLLRQEISLLLINRIKDPLLKDLNITDARATKDLSMVLIYFAASDQEQAKRIQSGLVRAMPFIRKEVGKNLHLRRIPELRFLRDEALETGMRLDTVLREIHSDTSDEP